MKQPWLGISNRHGRKPYRPTLTDYKGDASSCPRLKALNYFKTFYGFASYRSGLDGMADAYNVQPLDRPGGSREGWGITAHRSHIDRSTWQSSWMRLEPESSGNGYALVMLPKVYQSTSVSTLLSRPRRKPTIQLPVVVSRDDDGTVYVSETLAGFVQTLLACCASSKPWQTEWKPQLIGIEQVQYQAACSCRSSYGVPNCLSVAFVQTRTRVTRFAPLEARYEQGQVIHY